MPFQPILAADVIELLARGIPVILFVLWLIGQALSERQKQGKMAPRQANPVPQQPQQPQQPKRANTEIEDEIDAFLRRAAEKKGQQPDRRERERQREETVILVPPQQEARGPQPAVPPQRTERPRTGQAAPGRSLPQPIAAAQAAAAQRARPAVQRPAVLQSSRPLRRSSLGSLQPLESTDPAQAAPHLAAEISLADERMQAHLESTFDHRLGSLQHREVAPTRRVAGSPIAESIVKMLRDPQGIQQMIVANEILRRPEL